MGCKFAGLAGVAAAVIGISACGGGSGYTPADPTHFQECVAAWVKLHDDGITARVAASPTAAALEVQHMADMSHGAVCAGLNQRDWDYAVTQINARTGDNYKR